MGVIVRGAKNAFRNTIRTLSVTLILALSIGLALIMLLSYQTVKNKIASVQASIGNTVTVTPAGAQGFEGGGNPLTDANVTTVQSLPHISSVVATLTDRQSPTTDTSLQSPITPGTLGQRTQRFNANGGEAPSLNSSGGAGAGGTTRTFTIPIQVTGISDASALVTGTTKLTSGAMFDPSKDADVAVIGSDLATKNSLKVGSTFTAYSGTTFTVVGIYDAGTEFGNAGFYLPLSTLQRLSSQTGDITQMTVTVDTIGNVDGVVTAIQNKLGTSVADVTSNESQANDAIAPLQNIENISLYSLIGALVAGGVITLLTMIMIVRERRREIGVLKAIGASNTGVVTQFIAESLVLTLLGAVVGMIVGVIFSNPVLNALVNNSTTSTTVSGGPGAGTTGAAAGGALSFAGRGGQGVARAAQFIGGGLRGTITNLHATVGFNIIGYGLLAAILVAIIGSAIPAWLIAKVKPAEVMRGE